MTSKAPTDWSWLINVLIVLGGIVVIAIISVIAEKIKEGWGFGVGFAITMVIGIYCWITAGSGLVPEDTWKSMRGR